MTAVEYFFHHEDTEATENQTPWPPCLRGENFESSAYARIYNTPSFYEFYGPEERYAGKTARYFFIQPAGFNRFF